LAPMSVSCTLRVVRTRSCAPRAFSSTATRWLNVDFGMSRARAAARKLPWRTTATKATTAFGSTDGAVHMAGQSVSNGRLVQPNSGAHLGRGPRAHHSKEDRCSFPHFASDE